MKVKELIEELQKLDQDLEIYVDDDGRTKKTSCVLEIKEDSQRAILIC